MGDADPADRERHAYLARLRYSPLRVSTVIISPMPTKGGTVTFRPVSRIAGLNWLADIGTRSSSGRSCPNFLMNLLEWRFLTTAGLFSQFYSASYLTGSTVFLGILSAMIGSERISGPSLKISLMNSLNDIEYDYEGSWRTAREETCEENTSFWSANRKG